MTCHIDKKDLKAGVWYKGECRNASVAFWDGHKFTHMRYKLGAWFPETIACPEDEEHYDVFYPQGEIITNGGEFL